MHVCTRYPSCGSIEDFRRSQRQQQPESCLIQGPPQASGPTVPGVAVKGSCALDARLGGDPDFKLFGWQRGELLPFSGLRLGDAELGEGWGPGIRFRVAT